MVDMRVVVEVWVAQVGRRPRSASALPQQQKVALNASLVEVIGNMDRGRAQGGRTQHDFSLAWLEAA